MPASRDIPHRAVVHGEAIISGKQSDHFLQPLVYAPLILPHKHTIIMLHGRGDTARSFAAFLFMMPLHTEYLASLAITLDTNAPGSLGMTAAGSDRPNTKTESEVRAAKDESQGLRVAFPHARFVFPSAPERSVATLKGSTRPQWFDVWSLQRPMEQVDIQVDGIRETTMYLHDLIRNEAQLLDQRGGSRAMALGGLSQGCASSLIAAIMYEEQGERQGRLGAVFGMCGWLPLGDIIMGTTMEATDEVATLFATNTEEDGIAQIQTASVANPELLLKARSRLHSFLRIPTQIMHEPNEAAIDFQATPVFLGHGRMDRQIPIQLGEAAASCMEQMGARVAWHEYKTLGHWYSPEMLTDLAKFLRAS